MKVRDRIKELRRVRAGDLRPHPRNWRLHPDSQRNALRGILAEVGFADALLARELPDGQLELIDGHLRAETLPEQELPVLVLDVDEAEANKLLATLDPLSEMAETDRPRMAELIDHLDVDNEDVNALLQTFAREPTAVPNLKLQPVGPPCEIPQAFQVIVECSDEGEQQKVFEQLTEQGYACRVLTM
jgi:ParB-like chromosome segregation protein Spo0J